MVIFNSYVKLPEGTPESCGLSSPSHFGWPAASALLMAEASSEIPPWTCHGCFLQTRGESLPQVVASEPWDCGVPYFQTSPSLNKCETVVNGNATSSGKMLHDSIDRSSMEQHPTAPSHEWLKHLEVQSSQPTAARLSPASLWPGRLGLHPALEVPERSTVFRCWKKGDQTLNSSHWE